MARRKSSFLEDLVEAPWPVGVIAGFVILFFGLGLLPAMLSGSSNPFLAMFGQLAVAFAPVVIIVAMGCWAAALMSALRRRQRRRLLDTRTHLDSLRAMSWRELEQLVAEAYQRMGFQVEENRRGGADGGIDLRLRRNGELTLVQCKHWRSQRVGAPVVREQLGLLTHHAADAVVVVTTGDFTAEARAFAKDKPIELLAGPELLALVQSVQESPAAAPRAPIAAAVEPIACPSCGSAMVRRTARRKPGRRSRLSPS